MLECYLKSVTFCPEPVLKSLYYSLFNSHLSYGITLWGVANNTLLEKIVLLQKRAIRAITKSDFLAHTDPLFSNLKILKMDDTYLLKLASLMWDYDHNLIPNPLTYGLTRLLVIITKLGLLLREN